ncbi:hypothetical protein C8F01DRAFT_1252869 [Mycena amicta]|nr:hypothetical protein C8F01DRAFT_1252869 [Mycena amicta]
MLLSSRIQLGKNSARIPEFKASGGVSAGVPASDLSVSKLVQRNLVLVAVSHRGAELFQQKLCSISFINSAVNNVLQSQLPVSWLPASRFIKSAGARCSFVTKTINCNQTAVTSLPPLNITQSSSNAFKMLDLRAKCYARVSIVIAHQQSLPLPLVRNGAEFEDHLYALEEIKQVIDGVCRKHRVSGLPKKWNAKWSESSFHCL